MPGRGGSGNYKAAVKNVDNQTKGSVRSVNTSTSSTSSTRRNSKVKTKAGITLVQRPAAPTLQSGRRGFAHTRIDTPPSTTSPHHLLSPSLAKFDFGEDYLGRSSSSVGFSTSADADIIEPPITSPPLTPARAGRGGLGNAMYSTFKDVSGQSMISSVSGGSLMDKMFGAELGVIDAQSSAIWITTTITVDYSPNDVRLP